MNTNTSNLFGPGGNGPKMIKRTMLILGLWTIAKWFIDNRPRGEGGQSLQYTPPRLVGH